MKSTVIIMSNFKVEKANGTLKGFGNSRFVTFFGTSSVQIGLDGVAANNAKLRIVPDVQPKDVIIGHIFTDLPGV